MTTLKTKVFYLAKYVENNKNDAQNQNTVPKNMFENFKFDQL